MRYAALAVTQTARNPMAPPLNPPLPGKTPPADAARERLRQFEESRGLPPSIPELDPDEGTAEPAPPATDCEDADAPSPD
jgi:hypothetical protein